MRRWSPPSCRASQGKVAALEETNLQLESRLREGAIADEKLKADATAALEAKVAELRVAATQHAQAVETMQADLGCLGQAKEELQTQLWDKVSAFEELEARFARLEEDTGATQGPGPMPLMQSSRVAEVQATVHRRPDRDQRHSSDRTNSFTRVGAACRLVRSKMASAAPREQPAEAVMILDLLKTLGIKQYDPRVVDCLLDLTYKAASDILSDAEAINLAAGGNGASLTPQDIALAAAQHARLQPQPPSMQELHALARRINAQPLTGPDGKQHGIKLPPVADCLLSQNFQVKPRQRPQAPPAAPQQQQPQGQQQPRQHFAVKQQPGKIGLALPQQGWQPPADAAGAAAEPFAPPTHGQQQQGQQQQQGGGAGPAAMDVEFEDI
ncbi:hypothetical protein COHA_009653 [Chlorella ohadii]|uniref:Transcription initiation factor TFIID subunit 9 n=1 Tax=Chlorella ohadii TaxID=2649997 RepID=A0AAD5DEB4_9CHLO|nr:hypothetical protein COHA_009653 [Chlorella ohadii]